MVRVYFFGGRHDVLLQAIHSTLPIMVNAFLLLRFIFCLKTTSLLNIKTSVVKTSEYAFSGVGSVTVSTKSKSGVLSNAKTVGKGPSPLCVCEYICHSIPMLAFIISSPLFSSIALYEQLHLTG